MIYYCYYDITSYCIIVHYIILGCVPVVERHPPLVELVAARPARAGLSPVAAADRRGYV